MERELRVDLQPIQAEVQQALLDQFGTPDQPRWPDVMIREAKFKMLTEADSLVRASGAFGRKNDKVERGLYRKHCVQCHGITGDGAGPAAAMLSPYPRDFRRGTFKFKSTPQGVKPTLQDLIYTIRYGVPGTSMPAMANITKTHDTESDIEVIASYVRYLSIRGEVERTLMMDSLRDLDLDANESLYQTSLRSSDSQAFEKQVARIDNAIQSVADKWLTAELESATDKETGSKDRDAKSNDEAETQSIEEGTAKVSDSENAKTSTLDSENELADQAIKQTVTAANFSALSQSDKDRFLASANRGRKIFQSEIAACSQCHGAEGRGDGRLRDFDEWTKDWTVRNGIDPNDKAQWKPLKKLGLLKPIVASPRNLQLGVIRSGRDHNAIHRVILHGIEGTPMPAAARLPEVKNGLSETQVWDLVNYCQSLSLSGVLEPVAQVTSDPLRDKSK